MLEAGKDAVAKAFKEAGITVADIDIAEVHDCFTINQLLTTEALGLSADGKAGFDYVNGRFGPDDAQVSINLSGGLKAKGHPVGATGASMHALVYKQLDGTSPSAWRRQAHALRDTARTSTSTSCVSGSKAAARS